MKHKTFTNQNGKSFERISGWRPINYVDKYSDPDLFDQLTKYEGEEDISYFTFKGISFSLIRFVSLCSMWVNSPENLTAVSDNELVNLTAVDMEGDLYYPLYIEIDEAGENVRVYKQVKTGWF